MCASQFVCSQTNSALEHAYIHPKGMSIIKSTIADWKSKTFDRDCCWSHWKTKQCDLGWSFELWASREKNCERKVVVPLQFLLLLHKSRQTSRLTTRRCDLGSSRRKHYGALAWLVQFWYRTAALLSPILLRVVRLNSRRCATDSGTNFFET